VLAGRLEPTLEKDARAPGRCRWLIEVTWGNCQDIFGYSESHLSSNVFTRVQWSGSWGVNLDCNGSIVKLGASPMARVIPRSSRLWYRLNQKPE
jgi:hypothetical protein